tara:strand:- start:2491 stop:3345 length:855 start_codon:yes stop_codon:yes gene_type:complete
MSASVRARLLNLAKATGEDFQAIVLRYAVERFLARLATSPHRNQFVLKGAMLYVAWRLDDKRTTMDLDLLGFGNPDPKHLAEVIGSVCTVTMEDDGLEFDGTKVAASAIREDSVYDGVRVVVPVYLGVMPIRLQVDVGFGDIIVPEPRQAEFPALLAERGPIIATYSPETVIAEKFHAMVLLGMANSRMKDYFDIWMLSQTFPLNENSLCEAIRSTFIRRQTPLPESTPLALTDEFANNESKRLQWAGFVKRQRRQPAPPDLPEIVRTVREFLENLSDGPRSLT